MLLQRCSVFCSGVPLFAAVFRLHTLDLAIHNDDNIRLYYEFLVVSQRAMFIAICMDIRAV